VTNLHKMQTLKLLKSSGEITKKESVMRKKKQRNLEYKADLLADLRDDAEFAAEYLSAAYADSHGAFLVALRDVAEARKGISKVASLAKVNRESLYRALSESGNPTFCTLGSIWDVLQLGVQFYAKRSEITHGEKPSENDEIKSKPTSQKCQSIFSNVGWNTSSPVIVAKGSNMNLSVIAAKPSTKDAIETMHSEVMPYISKTATESTKYRNASGSEHD
jgi:probable addiction module antidote protein